MKDIKKSTKTKPKKQVETKDKRKKVSKAWEAAQRLKGSVTINDPALFLL